MSEPIPYDEMRAILGLPDVKREVERMRVRLALARMQKVVADFVEAISRLGLIATDTRRSDYVLAAGKDADR